MVDYIKSLSAGINLSPLSVSSIKLSDVVDILLVAYIIYVLITWIQKTRAWSVFKGIGVIIFVMGLSQLFQLNSIYWLISKTFSVGIIALIVIFQPEFRRALEQIGKGGNMTGIFSNGTEELSRQTVTEVVSAAVTMARVKTGALIVIGHDKSLTDYENTGIGIDALVSAQLLINIFEKNTPMHDGAVIIRNNRVAAATCILPLTEENLDKDLGTRHRAAVGMSELCDASVLVVSEETGGISVARAGKLFRGLNADEIFELLLDDGMLNLRKGRTADEKID